MIFRYLELHPEHFFGKVCESITGKFSFLLCLVIHIKHRFVYNKTKICNSNSVYLYLIATLIGI